MKEQEKNAFIEWVKAHKKQLILAGVGITAIIVAILVAKNKAEILAAFKELEKAFAKCPGAMGDNSFEEMAEVMKSDVVKEMAQAVADAEPDLSSVDKIPFDVQKHIRNLHEGYHASAEKIATAAENGIELLDNQTWVKDYTKGLDIAA